MNSRTRGPSGLRPEFVLRYTASVINIDPVVSGKHIGVSQLAQARSQHPYEETVDACSVYRFNSYERRCTMHVAGFSVPRECSALHRFGSSGSRFVFRKGPTRVS